jgi:hypothetical protein
MKVMFLPSLIILEVRLKLYNKNNNNQLNKIYKHKKLNQNNNNSKLNVNPSLKFKVTNINKLKYIIKLSIFNFYQKFFRLRSTINKSICQKISSRKQHLIK